MARPSILRVAAGVALLSWLGDASGSELPAGIQSAQRCGLVARSATGLPDDDEDPTPPFEWPAGLPQYGGGRWFEFDEGRPVMLYLRDDAWDLFGAGVGLQVLGTAAATWLSVPDTDIDVRVAAVLPPGELPPRYTIPQDEPARITTALWVDPSPVPCRAAGDTTTTFDLDYKIFGGRTWFRMGDSFARIVFNPADTLEACPTLQPCEFVNVAAHEFGHALGVLHLPNPAIMGFSPDFCGCGALTDADRAALRRRYPATRPPTITTPRHLPPPGPSQYAVQLEAKGGTGEFTWSVGMLIEIGTLVPDELPYWLSLSPTGLLTGYPGPYSSTAHFVITATDGHGESHTKFFIYPGGGREGVTTTTTSTTLGDPPTGHAFPCVPPTTLVVTLPVVTTTTSTSTTLAAGPCGAQTACAVADCLLTTEVADVEAALPRTARRTARALQRFRRTSRGAVASLTTPHRRKRARMLASRAARLSTRLSRLLGRDRERARLGELLADHIEGVVVAVRDAVGWCVTLGP